MLLELHIENFTIIDRCGAELANGMTVLTGETGAGKSILVDALGFVLGGRADNKYIRHGTEQADIIANFRVESDSSAATWLQDNGFDSEDCVLRRVLNREGRTRAYINGKPATLQQLKTLGSLLVNIHGQHEHYALLKREPQLARLDHYAGHGALLKQVSLSYQNWKHTLNELEHLKTHETERESRLNLLTYQVEEMQQLELGVSELDELHREQQKLSHAQELMQLSAGALHQLYEGEQDTILGQLSQLQKQFNEAARAHQELQGIAAMLSEAAINIKECSHELRDYHDTLSLDPERLQTIEARLEAIHKLARKHRVAPEQLYAHQESLLYELNSLKAAQTDISQLEDTLQNQAEQYLKLAGKLSHSRQKAAKALSQEVTASMQSLGLSGGKFNIGFDNLAAGQFSVSGQEKISFMVSTNPGQPMLPMSDVVSGGELSRIGLAIQVLTAERSATPTLIFDEVDVGIGGATAEVVGKLLRKLGEHCQVLCVTHLPQVAAQAQQHIYVEKIKDNHSTVSQLQILDFESRTQEIARMLGGLHITQQTLKTAAEMLGQPH